MATSQQDEESHTHSGSSGMASEQEGDVQELVHDYTRLALHPAHILTLQAALPFLRLVDPAHYVTMLRLLIQLLIIPGWPLTTIKDEMLPIMSTEAWHQLKKWLETKKKNFSGTNSSSSDRPRKRKKCRTQVPRRQESSDSESSGNSIPRPLMDLILQDNENGSLSYCNVGIYCFKFCRVLAESVCSTEDLNATQACLKSIIQSHGMVSVQNLLRKFTDVHPTPQYFLKILLSRMDCKTRELMEFLVITREYCPKKIGNAVYKQCVTYEVERPPENATLEGLVEVFRGNVRELEDTNCRDCSVYTNHQLKTKRNLFEGTKVLIFCFPEHAHGRFEVADYNRVLVQGTRWQVSAVIQNVGGQLFTGFYRDGATFTGVCGENVEKEFQPPIYLENVCILVLTKIPAEQPDPMRPCCSSSLR